MKVTRTLNIAVLVDTSLQGGRDFVMDVTSWVRAQGAPWRLIIQEGRFGEQQIDLKHEPIDGIIASCAYAEAVKPLARRDVPIVTCEPFPADLRQLGPLRKCPAIIQDSLAVGALAARYYLDRQYRTFAYVGDTLGTYWSRRRQEGFVKTLAKTKFKCNVYKEVSETERLEWQVERPRMMKWLQDLEKPVAIFAAMDGRARLVLDACDKAGIKVPEEVSVLGVDNDITLCKSAYPELSTIHLDSMGERAAEMLFRLLSGRPVKRQTVEVRPLSVITRESTGYDAMRYPVIARALNFIFHAAPEKNISAADVIRELKCSRRLVEIAFRKHLGRSIMDEIRHVKFEHVKELLETTALPFWKIAERCAFPTQSQLALRFHKLFGVTMREWRATHAGAPQKRLLPS